MLPTWAVFIWSFVTGLIGRELGFRAGLWLAGYPQPPTGWCVRPWVTLTRRMELMYHPSWEFTSRRFLTPVIVALVAQFALIGLGLGLYLGVADGNKPWGVVPSAFTVLAGISLLIDGPPFLILSRGKSVGDPMMIFVDNIPARRVMMCSVGDTATLRLQLRQGAGAAVRYGDIRAAEEWSAEADEYDEPTHPALRAFDRYLKADLFDELGKSAAVIPLITEAEDLLGDGGHGTPRFLLRLARAAYLAPAQAVAELRRLSDHVDIAANPAWRVTTRTYLLTIWAKRTQLPVPRDQLEDDRRWLDDFRERFGGTATWTEWRDLARLHRRAGESGRARECYANAVEMLGALYPALGPHFGATLRPQASELWTEAKAAGVDVPPEADAFPMAVAGDAVIQ